MLLQPARATPSLALLLLLTCVGTGAACRSNTPAAPAAAGAAGSGPDTSLDPKLTIAMVNGQPVTAGELDELAKGDLDKLSREFLEKVHEVRQGQLETLLEKKLFDLEAKARGTSVGEMLKLEIESAVPGPSDAELRQAFDTFVAPRFQISFEEAAPRLRQEMMGEAIAQKRNEFLQGLKAKYGVQVKLPEPKVPRIQVAATGPAKGKDGAKVTIVEFSDFECPFCSRANTTVQEVVKKYGDQVKLVFRQYPLPFHNNAKKAAEASLCAHDQGKFWPMHDALFNAQDRLDVPSLKEHAKSIGLDAAKFDACLDGGTHAAVVEKDLKEGEAAGVSGTPAFFINGKLVSGAQPLEAFTKVIDAELAN